MSPPSLNTTRRRSRWGRVGVGLIAASFALAACGSETETSANEGSESPTDGGSGDFGDITVQLSWIKNAEFAGEFMADSKGYYTDAGFSGVTLAPGPTSTENLVAAGKADFGLSNAVSVAQAIANGGAPLKVVATTYQKNPFTILSLADSGNITTPEDLKGKKIGVQDSNASLFDALLATNGIDASELDIVPVQYDPSVLTDGQVDGFLAYLTNESIIVASEGYEVANLPFADNGLPFVAESVVVTDEMIASEPDKIKAFLKAEIQGWTDACDDPEAGAKLAVEDYGKDIKPPLEMDKEIEQAEIQCEELINTDETAENGIFTISEDMIAENMATMEASGIDITAEELFDTSLLDELLADEPDLTP